MGAVSIEIPERYVERFQAEAESTLRNAADQLSEQLKWRQDARERGERIAPDAAWDKGIAKARERLVAAEELAAHVTWDPAVEHHLGDGLHPEAEVETLANTVQGCLQEAIEDLGFAAASTRDPDPTTAIPAAQMEIEFWRQEREGLRERGEVPA